MAKISAVEPQKRNKERVNVYVDGEFYCGMQAFSALKFGIKEGAVVEIDTILASIFDSEVEMAFIKAVNLICKTMKTQKQMTKYLTEKGFSDKVVEEVLTKLKGYRYIDDENFARLYVEQNGKTKGAMRLRQELILKGVPRQIVEKTLDDNQNDDAQNINQLAKKYMRNKFGDLKTLAKLQRHLLSRGYSFEEIRPIVDQYKENSSEQDFEIDD